MADFYEFDTFKKFISESLTTAKEQKATEPVKTLKQIIGKTIFEEKDPDDHKTGSLLPGLDDKPELTTIHHRIDAVTTNHHGDVLSRHTVGTKSYQRSATESAEAFGNRVLRKVEDGHEAGYDGGVDGEGAVATHTYSPHNTFKDLTDEEGSHSIGGNPRWMHAGSTHPIVHSHGGGMIVHNFEHHLQVGHHAK